MRYRVGIENELEHIDYWDYEENELELAQDRFYSLHLRDNENKYLLDLNTSEYLKYRSKTQSNTIKKYEIALLFGSYKYHNVETYEYNTMEGLQEMTKYVVGNKEKDLYKIELSILEQDADGGDNLNSYTFCEIDMLELVKGENLK